MNYLDRIALRIQRAVDPMATAPGEHLPLYRLYAVLALAKGQAVTAEDVHNAWAAWASGRDPGHRHIKPFAALSASVQDQDEPFAAAIRQVADQMAMDA